jgi:two-component system, cell cycle response regulator
MKTIAPTTLSTILTSRDLPTLPTVAAKLLTLMGQEETSVAEIAGLVAQDAALAVKIIRAANSSFYSFPNQINTVHQAVALLGSNAVRSLVLTFSLLLLKVEKKTRFDHTRFWERSLAGAAAAMAIARQVPGTDKEEIFIAGLLQNIGELIFAATITDEYDDFLGAMVNCFDGELEQREQEALAITHSQAGYEVAKRWGLPDLLLETIHFHHRPSEYQGGNGRLAGTIKIIFLADLLVGVFFSATPETSHKRFRQEAEELLGLNGLTIDTILKEVAGEIDAAAEYFGLNLPPTKSVMEILQEANLKLGQLNLTYEELNRELTENKIILEKMAAELAHKNHLLETQLRYDHLTEVANRKHFKKTLDQELNRATRNGEIISLLLIDIDWFKKVNDTHGHLAGDFVLKEFCAITQKNIRDYDLLARYGGEEFAVILPGTSPENALLVAEKIRKNTEEHDFQDGRLSIRITVSIGIASVRPSHRPATQFEVIGWADKALYQAKNKGRNRVIYLDSRHAGQHP